MQLLTELVDDTGASPCSHCSTQLIGFPRSKSCRHNCQLHALLLEERDAECLLQHSPDRFIGIRFLFFTETSSQVRVNHVTLNRTGTHDSDLDHEIVVAAWLEPGEHRHLGPALNLKHSHRVGTADHLIHTFISFGDTRQREGLAGR
jgi:hypothetical protein